MGQRRKFLKWIFLIISFITIIPSFCQDATGSKFNTGADIFSSYIWRGTIYGRGPAVQPSIEYASGNFTLGAWGSFDFNGYQETDLYFIYSLRSGLEIGLTDYYFMDLRYFDYSSSSGSHAFELNMRFTRGNFNIQANYIVNKADGAGSAGGDKYFEAGYVFKSFNLFIGAGDGWHTLNPEMGRGRFNLCNVGIGTTKTIIVTDSFNIPVKGQLVLNPDKEQLSVIIGFSF